MALRWEPGRLEAIGFDLSSGFAFRWEVEALWGRDVTRGELSPFMAEERVAEAIRYKELTPETIATLAEFLPLLFRTFRCRVSRC